MPMPLIPNISVFRSKLAGFPIATYQAGETVVAAGSTTGRLLILRKGLVAVLKEGVEIATVTEPGAVFGELSVLLDQPHMTMVDLLLRPELVAAAKTYFNDVQLKSQRPQSLLAETDQPQVQINRDTMARFRPEMRKFYYDASKYDTYLDQLGVKFPQLTKPQ